MSKKRTIHGIDPYAPGGIEALLAHHRQAFGDATMSVAPGEAAPAGEPAPAAVPAAVPAPVVPAVAPVEPAPAQKVEDLPAWAQKIINDTRAEAASNRTGKTAAEQNLEAITKLLNPDAEPAAADPAALAQSIAAKDSTIAELRAENTILSKGGSPLMLTVLKGEGALTDLDPTATDFQAKLDGLIKDAETRYPQLKTVQAAGASGGDFTGGSGEKPAKQSTIAGAVAKHYGA